MDRRKSTSTRPPPAEGDASRFNGATVDSFRLLERVAVDPGRQTVWRGEYLVTEEPVAVKVTELDAMTDKDLEVYLHERLGAHGYQINNMKSLSHKNIVSFYTSLVTDQSLWIIEQYMHYGSVRSVLEYVDFSENDVAYVLHSLLSGLSYLHQSDCIHRSVEGRHVLISKGGDIHLSSFALSTLLVKEGSRRAATTVCGRGAWTAPEVYSGTGYDWRSDIWSVGMTALEIARGKAPWENYDELKIALLLSEGEPPLAYAQELSKPFQEFVEACLKMDPEKRPTAKKLMDHRLFKNMKKKSDQWMQKLEVVPPLARRLQDQQAKLKEGILKTTSQPTILPVHPSQQTLDSGSSLSEPETNPVSDGEAAQEEGWEYPTPVEEEPQSELQSEYRDEEETPCKESRDDEGLSESREEAPEAEAPEAPKNGSSSPQKQPESSPVHTAVVSTEEEFPLHGVPVAVDVGESDTAYVVFVRAPEEATLNLTFAPKSLIIHGTLSPLPVMEGVRMRAAAPTEFRYTVPLSHDIADVESVQNGYLRTVKLVKLIS